MTKTILVTGASRGIGAAVAIGAGALGWKVGLNYASNRDRAAETAAKVREAGGEAELLPGDVADEAAVIEMFDAVERRFGKLDGVVVNAGVIAQRTPVAEMSLERMRRIIDVNVLGALLTAREAARRMGREKAGREGSMVILSSVAAKLGGPGEYVDYAASKGAMDSLTIGLAKELAPQGLRVNAVRPGLIETEIHADGGWADRAKVLGESVPWGRAGSADEVAESILWLLSDKASYVTGALLDVTGGR